MKPDASVTEAEVCIVHRETVERLSGNRNLDWTKTSGIITNTQPIYSDLIYWLEPNTLIKVKLCCLVYFFTCDHLFCINLKMAVYAHACVSGPVCLCPYLSTHSLNWYVDKTGQWKGRSVWAERPVPRTNMVPWPSLPCFLLTLCRFHCRSSCFVFILFDVV